LAEMADDETGVTVADVVPEAPEDAVPATVGAPGAEMPTETGVQAPVMSKKGLIAGVAEMTGLRKRDARAAIEAALELINRTLAASGEISAMPLGKIRVVRRKEGPNGTIFICRAKLGELAPDTPLAPEDE